MLSRMTDRRFAALLCLTLAMQTDVWAQQAEMQAGLKQLDRAQYNEAVQSFNEALKRIESINSDDARSEARLRFFRGLTRQKYARSFKGDLATNADAAKLLNDAIDDYQRAARMAPTSGAILFNLAQAHAQLGQWNEAKAAYLRAIDLADEQQPVYTLSLARLLEQQDDPDALRFYWVAVGQLPNGEPALSEALRFIRTRQPQNLEAFVCHVLNASYPRHARRIVRDLLTNRNEPVDNGALPGLLSTLLRSIARTERDVPADSEEQAGLLRKELDRTQSELRGIRESTPHAEVRDAVEELLNIHAWAQERSDDSPPDASWWTDRLPVPLEPVKAPPCGWPIGALQEFLRARGEISEQLQNRKLAEEYYRLAYTGFGRHVDPQAVVKLADLLVKQNRIGDLRRFLDREVVSLFTGKNVAIREDNYRRAYDYHRALGFVYFHLQVWGGRNDPASATFQLEHAIRAAENHNERVQSAPAESMIPVDAELVSMLAEALRRSSDRPSPLDPNEPEALRLLITHGRKYLQQGDFDQARLLLLVRPTEIPEDAPAALRAELKGIIEHAERSHVEPPDFSVELRFHDGGAATLIPVRPSAATQRALTEFGRLTVTQPLKPAPPGRYRLLSREAGSVVDIRCDGHRGSVTLDSPANAATTVDFILYLPDGNARRATLRFQYLMQP